MLSVLTGQQNWASSPCTVDGCESQVCIHHMWVVLAMSFGSQPAGRITLFFYKNLVPNALPWVKGQYCSFWASSEEPPTQLKIQDFQQAVPLADANGVAWRGAGVIPDLRAKGKEEKESRIHCYFRILGWLFLLDYEIWWNSYSYLSLNKCINQIPFSLKNTACKYL